MNSRDIKTILNKAAFNPKKVDLGMKLLLDQMLETNDTRYLEMRAIELINEARIYHNLNIADYEEKVIKAISLLSVCIYMKTT